MGSLSLSEFSIVTFDAFTFLLEVFVAKTKENREAMTSNKNRSFSFMVRGLVYLQPH